MRLTVVGCSGSVPGPASAASCYLIEADDAGVTSRVVLDLGAGSLGALQRFCDPRDVDLYALTHLHPDHCADTAALHAYLGYHPDGPRTASVVGPFGAAARITQLRGADAASVYLDVQVWQPDRPLQVGVLTLVPFAVEHSVPAYAVRVEGPSSAVAGERAVIAYSSDTAVCDGLLSAAMGAEVALFESSFLDTEDYPDGLHMTASQAARAAADAGAGRLVITHVPPWHDPVVMLEVAQHHFDGRVELAYPGMHVTV